MLVSYAWLREYVATTTSATTLGDRIMLSSSELEELHNWTGRLEGLIVGKVEEVTAHPESTKLNVAKVNLGRLGVEQIVCGASNLAKGQTVIVATVGTVLSPYEGDKITIAERTIRGVVSRGMLCGPTEFGLPLLPGYQESEIMVLDDSHQPGTPASKALGLADEVFDFSITPNRPDLLSYLGLAREVAALEKSRFQEPDIAVLGDQNIGKLTTLKGGISNPEVCYRYSAIELESDKFTIPSPLWMQARLAISGIKPINLVVDIANYCMLEYGHPLHTFDADAVAGKEIGVRLAKAGESLRTLDGNERTLGDQDIVITFDDQVDDLAGVMGGAHSAIKPTTTRVLVESACFSGVHIRRSSRRLGVRTEASGRFEKGLDPEQTVTVLRRAVYLLQKLAGAKITSKLLDIYPAAGSQERPRLSLTFARLEQITGVTFSAQECKTILQALGFQLSGVTKSGLTATPPSWRRDVTRSEDLIEEIVRIWGYEQLPSTLPKGEIRAPRVNQLFERQYHLRLALAAAGFNELVSLPFVGERDLQLAKINPEACAEIIRPLSADGRYLTPTNLVPFLQAITGPNREVIPLQLFEIADRITPQDGERRLLSLIVRDEIERGYELLLRKLKAGINQAVTALGLDASLITYEATTQEDLPAYYANGGAVLLHYAGVLLGSCGVIDESVVKNYKIRSGRALLFAELNLEVLTNQDAGAIIYQAPHRFPVITRSLTLVLPEDTSVAQALKWIDAIKPEVGERTVGEITLYRGKPYPADMKAITIALLYRHPERTLTDAEVQADIARLEHLTV